MSNMLQKLVVVLAALLYVGGILTVQGQGEQCFYLSTIAVIKITITANAY